MVLMDSFAGWGSSRWLCALFCDGGFWWSEGSERRDLPDLVERFYLLKSGDEFDLGARKVVMNIIREKEGKTLSLRLTERTKI